MKLQLSNQCRMINVIEVEYEEVLDIYFTPKPGEDPTPSMRIGMLELPDGSMALSVNLSGDALYARKMIDKSQIPPILPMLVSMKAGADSLEYTQDGKTVRYDKVSLWKLLTS